MPATQPNLTIDVYTNSGCSELLLQDTTGEYDVNTNVGGYGLPGGPTLDDITLCEIIVTYNSLGAYITYSFTVLSQLIVAATLAVGGGAPTNILTSLPSTVWPFEAANPFNLVDGYGVTLPTFTDDVFKVEYSIEGTVPDTFDFDTIAYEPVVCNSRCCINRKFIALDPSCGCSNDKIKSALYGEALLNQVEIAAEQGDLTGALQALSELNKLCGQEGDCGC